MEKKLNYKLLNILIIITIIFLLYLIKDLWLGFVISIFKIISPFLLAFCLAYVVYPIVRKLMEAGAPKWLSILTVCILGFGCLFLVLVLTIPLIYDQSILFISNISMLLSDLSTKYELNLGSLQSALTNFSKNVLSGLGDTISSGAFSVLSGSISAISTGVVVVCAAIYFLIDMPSIRRNVKKYVYKNSKRTCSFLEKLDDELTKYLGGLGKNILIQLMEYTIVFFAIGHPNYLVLGILSGLSAIIPWFGGAIVSVIALLVSSVISTKLFILTAIVCIVCPILDGNVIGPKVYGKSNQLHPLLVIFAVSAGGSIGGFWGIIVCLPVAIIIKTTINFYKKDIDDQVRLFRKKI